MRSFLRHIRLHPGGWVIILVWLAMLGLLFREHFFSSSLARVIAPTTVSGALPDEWMGIYFKGQKIGYAHSSISRENDSYRLRENTYLEMTLMEFPQKISMKVDALIKRDYSLQNFNFDLQSGLVAMRVRGEMKGNNLLLVMETAGTESRQTIPMPRPPYLPGSVRPLLAGSELKVGKKIVVPIYDPSVMTMRDMTVEVERETFIDIKGEKFPAYELSETMAGLKVTSWVNSKGETLKEESPMGFTMIRQTQTEALTDDWQGKAKIDLIGASAVTPAEGSAAIPQPRETTYLKVFLALKNQASFAGLDLNGGRQRFSYNENIKVTALTVEKETMEGLTPVTLPVSAPEFKPYLASDIFLQLDHPEIKKQAQAVVGGEKDALAAARLISDWVYKNLEKRAVVSIPNALEVLKMRAGDCNEHTILFTALARAVGLPTKICAGLVYVDEKFFYHAWPEVYVGRWVAIDPTFHQLPADAVHIRMITGGMDRQVELARVIGNLRIRVLEAK